jgi:HEPN domain-containing protein
LNEKFFLFLNANEAEFFQSEFPFGSEVAKAFQSTDYDAREAAQSYAVGRYTACVFHCMRVLEHGLRALANDVNRTFDRQQWKNIIDEIESEIVKIREKGPKSAEKDERLKWLSEAAKEFFYSRTVGATTLRTEGQDMTAPRLLARCLMSALLCNILQLS